MAKTAFGAAAVLVSVLGGGAFAQAPVPLQTDPLMTDPGEIAACLCLNQSVQGSGSEVAAARALYEALKRSIADQDGALNARRPQVDVTDPAAVDAFREQMEKRDDDQNRLEQETYPALQARIAAYNAEVEAYGRRCGGRYMDEPVLKAVQAGLVCPARP